LSHDPRTDPGHPPPPPEEGSEALLTPENRGKTAPPETGSADSDPRGDESPLESAPAEGKKKEKKKKKDALGSARGVETMFRTSYRTHQDLSNLADNKANIMISINGIIISILFASMVDEIVVNRWLLLPTAVLLVGCVLSLVFAVLAARPRVTERTATLEDVREDKANILFFGTFTTMTEEDFYKGMRELIENPERTYGNMIRDIYGLGSVLRIKYRLLRISYTVFMLALITGVVLFLAVLGGAVGGGARFPP
jgi:hypothetical protein